MRKKITILTLILSLFYCTIATGAEIPVAKNGVLHLSSNQIQKSHKTLLHGNWFFFPDTLIQPDKLQLSTLSDPQFIPVPSKRKFTKNIDFGTYLLKIEVDNESDILQLNTLTIYSSATIFLNNELIGSIGKPATTQSETKPGLILRTTPFKLNKGTNHLVVHYANFNREKTGIANNIYISSPSQILSRSIIQIIKYAIILGTLLFIIFTQINYFFIHRQSRISLVFGLAAFCIFIYISFMSLYYMKDALPNFSPNLRIALTFWRLAYYGTVAFFVIYVYKLFPKLFYKPIAIFSVAYSAFSAIITILFPLHISSINFNLYMYFTMLISLFAAIIGVVGIFKKIEYSRLFVMGFAFFVLTVVNDILHNLLIINSINLLDIGIFGMMLTQAQIINLRLSQTILRNEKLSTHLQFVNNNLENIVKQRTEEIEEQKAEIETQRDEILSQRDQVKTQNKLILQQTKTITDSINYAREIQQAVLPDEKRLKEYFSDSFILYKPKDYVSGDFYWIRQLQINNQPNLLFCVADCTGHGVPGALLSMLGMTLLNEITNQNHDINNSSEILEKLRQRFKDTLSNRTDYKISSDGMHITLCIVNEITNEVNYSGAFQSLYHIHDNEIKRYKGTHSIIGNYIQEKSFEQISFTLEKNDRLYLFTDGFADQISGNGDGRFMQKELLRLLCSYDGMSLERQKELLNYEFEAWRGDFEQIDDVLIMGLKA